MIKLRHGKTLAWLLVVSLGIPNFTQAATPEDSNGSTKGEHQIEEDRDQAILEALITVDPSLAPQNVIEGEVGPDQAQWITQEVGRLRQARHQQFKHLPMSHIKTIVTPQTVGAKQKFLQTREKNLSEVLNRSTEVYIPAQIAKDRMTLARFRIAKAIRSFLPEAGVTGNIKSGSLSGSSFLSDNWRMQFRVPVFRGGVLWNTLFLEMANLEVAKREYDKAISDLVADVFQAYFEFERSRNVLYDREGLFEKAKQQKKISDEKYNAKLTSEIEKLNADSLYSQAQYDLETAQQEVEIAKLELQKFLDLETGDPIEVAALYSLEGLNVDALKQSVVVSGSNTGGQFENDLDRLIELTYEHRSDLQVEAAKLKATQFAYRVALGQRLPKFDLLVEFGELAEAFIQNLDSKRGPKHSHEFRFGMEMTWPLLGNTLKWAYDHDQHAPSVTQFLSGQGTRTRSNTLSANLLDDMGQFSSMIEAKISNLEQVVELEKTERDVVREVKEAYFNFNKAMIQVESAYKRMGYRSRLAQLAKHRLETNEVQISEYLQAEMDFVQERSLVYKAMSDFFLSKAKLNRAIGIRDYLAVEVLK
ncbi:MAG: hypothetical protein A3C35_03510 [Omnitrophica bacterium RIFCSPHIGHO2_02_FULL_46_11]|nr:MAG: hypothetical protein A3C35_03510 [Omnitrophica bacterium RIFCSPHIGHO2_02_FULL_46_11]OGW88002.1 MAG: hypothetical protein A3A81_09005 [Omnitrophica bacterium RIFCSPLOWO2_01_FULL_45_10b]